MKLKAHKTDLPAILPLRNLFLQETNFQIRYNACDSIFEHKLEPIGEYVLELEGEVAATGGYFLHYNMPFTDLYMEVKENFRKKRLASFIIQELKKTCYLAGRVPAARCNIQNKASRATLLKAGLRVCGFMLKGEIKNEEGYISLTDMVKNFGDDTTIYSWMRNRNTLEFIGI